MRTNANMRLLRILPLQPSRSTHTVVLKDFSASVVDVCERSYSDVEVVCQEWLARKMWTQSSVLQVREDATIRPIEAWLTLAQFLRLTLSNHCLSVQKREGIRWLE